MDTVKTASAGGVMMDTATTGTVTEMPMATEIGTENVTAIVGTTGAATLVVVTSTTAGSVVTKTTVAEIIVMRSGDIVLDHQVGVVRKALHAVVVVVAVVAGAKGGMDLVLPSAGPLHLRVRFLSPSEGAKLLDGMFMLQDMNNIRPCRPNKQVGWQSDPASASECHGFQVFSTFLERTVHKFLPSLALPVYPLQFQSRLLEWASGATRTCLGNPGASTLAASHLRSMSRTLRTSSTAR
jgi:hypothetical protein